MSDPSLVTNLLKSRRRTGSGDFQFQGDVVVLVQAIESFCRQNSLRLGRYQERTNNGRVFVHWIIYQGQAADSLDEIAPAQVLESIKLVGIEGSTRRCEAYRNLAAMFDAARRRIDA